MEKVTVAEAKWVHGRTELTEPPGSGSFPMTLVSGPCDAVSTLLKDAQSLPKSGASDSARISHADHELIGAQ